MYWAAKDNNDIGGAIGEQIERYYQYINTSGMLGLWRKIYRQFYNGYFINGDILRDGEQGQLRRLYANHFKNLLTHVEVLTTGQRPEFDPKATNTDHKSSAQAIIAKNLLQHYLRQEHLEQEIQSCVRNAILFGEGWLASIWDEDKGEDFAVKKGEMIKTGDMTFRRYLPMDVIRDSDIEDVAHHNWYIVCHMVNKYDLATKYKDFAEEIVSFEYESSRRYSENIYLDRKFSQLSANKDMIPMYILWHKKTPSLPDGRQVIYIDDDIVLSDRPLPYQSIPLQCIMPDEREQSAFGHSVSFDILPLQKAYDACASVIATNNNAFGISNIVAQAGSGVTIGDIEGALRLIYYNSEKPPEVLQLLKTPPEIYNFMQMLQSMMELIVGINQISRGNPERQMSGSAMALLQNMALQFNSGLQHSYALFCEKLGTGIINIVKEYSQVPRVLRLVGKSNAQYLPEFVGDDIGDIDRVIVDLGNPMGATVAGRLQLAQDLLQMGAINNPKQYIQVINTGNFENLIEGDTAELMLIKSENEALVSGEKPVAIVTDDHAQHIKEHKTVLASVQARQEQNAVVVENTLAHIQEHINELKAGDPVMMGLINQPQVQAPPAPQGQQGQGLPNQPQQPNLPNDALTGEQFQGQEGV